MLDLRWNYSLITIFVYKANLAKITVNQHQLIDGANIRSKNH